MKNSSRTLYIFDLDNTLYEGYSSVAGLRTYFKKHSWFVLIVGTSYISLVQLAFKIGLISYDRAAELGTSAIVQLYKRMDLQEYGAILDEYDFESKLIQGAKDVIEDIKKSGNEVMILSGSNELTVSRLSEILGVKWYECSLFDLESWDVKKFYNGKAKRKFVESIKSDWGKVVGVGDSETDLEFMKVCDRGFLINWKGGEVELGHVELIEKLNKLITQKGDG